MIIIEQELFFPTVLFNYSELLPSEILALTSNQTLLVRKNRPKEFKGEPKLSPDQKKSLTTLLKSASSSCQFTPKHKLFAFVQSANGNVRKSHFGADLILF